MSEGMFSLKISKEFYRYHRAIKKAVENITKLRIWNKRKDFKSLLSQDQYNLKQVITKKKTNFWPALKGWNWRIQGQKV